MAPISPHVRIPFYNKRDRMKIINRIVKELWRATYRGNDIDYIEIKTDESDGVSAGADKRKIYNYKVCERRMAKN